MTEDRPPRLAVSKRRGALTPNPRRTTLPPRDPDPPLDPPLSDAELRESVALLSELAVSVSDRLDAQAPTLGRVDSTLRSVGDLARAAHDANKLAARGDDRLERATHSIAFQSSDMRDTVAAAQRMVDELRNASYRSDHILSATLNAAEAWRTNARRLMLWAAPAALVLLLVVVAGAALLAPRVLPHSETLCALAGAAWVEDPDSARRGCWMEAGP